MAGPQVKLFQFFSSQVERQDVLFAKYLDFDFIEYNLTQSNTDICTYDVTPDVMSDLHH